MDEQRALDSWARLSGGKADGKQLGGGTRGLGNTALFSGSNVWSGEGGGQRALSLNHGFVFGCEGDGGLGSRKTGGGKRLPCIISFHWFPAPSRSVVCP